MPKYVCLSVCLSACPSVRLTICLSVSLKLWEGLSSVSECWAVVQQFLCSVYMPKYVCRNDNDDDNNNINDHNDNEK